MEDIFSGLKDDVVGLSVRSVYSNLFVARKEMVKQEDLKIREPVNDIDEVIKNHDYFSISANMMEGEVLKWLQKTFPQKSRCEL